MSKTVVIVGALDTKGKEFAFVKDLIEKQGLKTLVVDFGVMGKPEFAPDVTRDEVASHAGGNLAALSTGEHIGVLQYAAAMPRRARCPA